MQCEADCNRVDTLCDRKCGCWDHLQDTTASVEQAQPETTEPRSSEAGDGAVFTQKWGIVNDTASHAVEEQEPQEPQGAGMVFTQEWNVIHDDVLKSRGTSERDGETSPSDVKDDKSSIP